ncbi:radical SAM protein [Solimonas sp. SE-A11]|uniref:radical SAM protein n=1 Tax=Solimonas sp. SE-A11 TaxID=3054954 RepID=UPI00259CFAFB|nr:radical SAM protein [Solimonas sp. SE-A11]MDM4769276.1 radical SAM protein [Solimonas sp. SE-A11]
MTPARAPPFAQIEITTICNYRCFYCAGRDMPQQHMPMERFLGILERLPPSVRQVSLQGEGEPTAHNRFRDLVAAVRQRGLEPYTITNASLIRDPLWFAQAFPLIGISIDTLDAQLAESIGRLKLHRALKGVDRLIAAMGARRIVLHTVDFGQPLDDIREWARAKGFGQHRVQPLQGKADYVRSYRYKPPPRELPAEAPFALQCRYLEQAITSYYTLDGTELPCCFIKDTSSFRSSAELRADLAAGRVPASCSGCSEVRRAAEPLLVR